MHTRERDRERESRRGRSPQRKEFLSWKLDFKGNVTINNFVDSFLFNIIMSLTIMTNIIKHETMKGAMLA